MTISVTEFKSHCLRLLRQLESRREPIEITRHGKKVARIVPAGPSTVTDKKPWERLHGSGRLLSKAEEGVLRESDFKAAR